MGAWEILDKRMTKMYICMRGHQFLRGEKPPWHFFFLSGNLSQIDSSRKNADDNACDSVFECLQNEDYAKCCAECKDPKSSSAQDFPGGPVAEALCLQYRGPRLYPWSENQIPHAMTKSLHAATQTQSSPMNKTNIFKKEEFCSRYRQAPSSCVYSLIHSSTQ